MRLKKKVDFKGTKNGIVLHYSPELNFIELMEQVEKKLLKAKNFFNGAHIIGLVGPELTSAQEAELTEIIQRLGGMKVLTLEPISKEDPKEDAPIKFEFDDGELEETSEELPVAESETVLEDTVDAAEETPDQMLTVSMGDVKLGDKTLFHRGTLRSGRRLDSDGHIIVLGDVNPGAELSAAGNIVVMGALRGFAQAGRDGDDERIVVALKLQPTQIRIGKWITRPPDEGHEGPEYPEIAVVKENRIIIEPYR
ncbi:MULTISPECIES: septum site-determining protein MinC [unclassified Fusibacter]|uniref:septum site-determining protein MinC n=1 Tax=unclassified Fusibacter TaxID=2624464 RepID=UPI0010127B5F|nr:MULTISPECIES: septum site-determining protein MinC [unclassified Fusibacter]MCK8060672.1 septum site-determining protein MinC [Fusibacter sp. A2]NPE22874.1 septum site-determining protein MinC [Fusibacter sp. A1]RXV59943.1 septum site-determining protein MinC [Fusibacter sp. A1]